MSSVLDVIVKLPRYVRIRSTNGIDENNAIVDKDCNDKDRKERKRVISRNHYHRHKEKKLKNDMTTT